MGRAVTLFFSTRSGLEAPLFRELQAIPWLGRPAALAESEANAVSMEAALQQNCRPQREGGPRLALSPGGVSVHRVPLTLVQQLCCTIRTAECVWLRLWGPVPCSTAEHLQSAIRSIPWKKYVSPLSALPLLPLRVASIQSPIADSPSLRSALMLALQEAASAEGETAPAASTAAGAAAPSAQATAHRALVAAAHRLRIVCTRGQALADLQLSASLDPRPYRYLPHVPAAPAAAACTAQKAEAAPTTVSAELRLAALVAEAQRTAGRGTGAVHPSWSLTSAAAAAAAPAVAVKNHRGRFGSAEAESPSSQQPSTSASEELGSDNACYSSKASRDNSTSSSNSNDSNSSIHDESELLDSLYGASKEGASFVEPPEKCSQCGTLPLSPAIVSMLRLLYLKSGRVIDSPAGLTAPEGTTARAAASGTTTGLSMNAAAVWAAGRAAKEEGDVALGAAAAAAGLQSIFRREKRIVVRPSRPACKAIRSSSTAAGVGVAARKLVSAAAAAAWLLPQLWDPFCGDGALLLEAALLLGRLPPSVPEIPCGFNLIPALHAQQEEEKEALMLHQGRSAGAAPAASTEGVPLITLVGTDERLLLLHAARQRLRSFCEFFFGGQMPMDLETQQQLQQEHQQDAEWEGEDSTKPPFAMGLHEASPFEVSPFVSGGIIFTRIPNPREAKVRHDKQVPRTSLVFSSAATAATKTSNNVIRNQQHQQLWQ
ncbi:hypothetical protein ACSSS7_004298 [Eimeria intestinalis]